ncbi:GAP family protein [Nonomuraea sp. B19D2]|uniref:GAP family protein n=1 Tax=Nonomuraea sp. B19D2 TaxID=3159561 RepID=UPI0032DBA550
MLLLGLGTWLFEFATAVPYFGAIGIMTSAGLPAVQWSPLLGGYVTIMVIPGMLLFVAWAVLGERMRERFERWQNRLSSGSRTTLRWIVGIAGCLIFLEAADALLPEVTVVTPWG